MNNKLLGKIMIFIFFTGIYISIGINVSFYKASLIFFLTALISCFVIVAISFCSANSYTEAKSDLQKIFEF